MVLSHKLVVVILSEMMILEERTRFCLRPLHFYNVCFIPPVGLSGGFCVAWRDGVNLEPMYWSKNLISCLVFFGPTGCPVESFRSLWASGCLYEMFILECGAEDP
ncbi:hypothetical protein PanWU01x14_037380 [Parasponia andersonii]|uniref:Uncharacterized protein n=1 Tax=Parasponia andersonii TaxID=3476 RepID=A0A2P5DSQ3_PARAD|nr:hypothetical protein PanWU01x14_037380 [Parasponia andersonii]